MNIFASIKGWGFGVTFAFTSNGIPACTTQVMRGKKGLPWNDRVAVHPLPDGRVEVKAVSAYSASSSDV